MKMGILTNKTIMNENLNLVEILKDCPKGTKLYSPIFGEVEFEGVYNNAIYPIAVKAKTNPIEGKCTEQFIYLAPSGILDISFNSECMLFPSREQRDWSKFKPKKQPKFDPKALKPFDKILARNGHSEIWNCDIFSNIYDNEPYKYNTISNYWKYCIPYNEETKHLLGTKDEAPEYYRYWED